MSQASPPTVAVAHCAWPEEPAELVPLLPPVENEPPVEKEPPEPPVEKEPLEPPLEKEPLEPPLEKEPPLPLEPPVPEHWEVESAQRPSLQQTAVSQ